MINDKELDALVAEKVMGWTKKELPNNDQGLPYTAMYWVDKEGNKTKPVNFFSPSFNIKDAFEVMETFESWQVTKMPFKENYRAIVRANGNVVFSEKKSIAICLACLKAVGVDVK